MYLNGSIFVRILYIIIYIHNLKQSILTEHYGIIYCSNYDVERVIFCSYSPTQYVSAFFEKTNRGIHL